MGVKGVFLRRQANRKGLFERLSAEFVAICGFKVMEICQSLRLTLACLSEFNEILLAFQPLT